MASRRGWFKAALGAALAAPMAAAAKVLPSAVTAGWKVTGRIRPITASDFSAFEPKLIASVRYTLQHETIFNRLVERSIPPYLGTTTLFTMPAAGTITSASLAPEDVVAELDEFLAKRRAEQGDA